jgi:hypothetical protein
MVVAAMNTEFGSQNKASDESKKYSKDIHSS